MTKYQWTHLRVIYGDTDAMGVVYHSNYFRFFEVGRSSTFRALGYSYKRFESEGYMLPVTHCECSFTAPARYDDVIWIQTQLTHFKGARLKLNYKIYKQLDSSEIQEGPHEHMTLLVEGSTTHALVDNNLKPINVKKVNPAFYGLLEEFSCQM